MITAQSRTDESTEKEWAALLWQMRGATLLVSGWQAARGERVQAARLAALATDDLAVLHEQMQRRPLFEAPANEVAPDSVRTPSARSVQFDGQVLDRRVPGRPAVGDPGVER